jgi:hypothetical protein
MVEDLDKELTRARRQPWLTRSTGIMFALVLACGGFLAGIKVQQAYGSPASTSAQQQPNQAALNAALQQRGQGNNAAAAPTTGKVKLVDGATVYVELADGRVITVKTTETTTVQTATPGQLKDLAVGTTVSVQGTPAGTDTVTATSVTASAAK